MIGLTYGIGPLMAPAAAPVKARGVLTSTSKLREVFREGWVPLTSMFPAVLEGPVTGQPMRVVLIALQACTPEQKNRLATQLAEIGADGTYAECRARCDRDTALPVPFSEFTMIHVVYSPSGKGGEA